jgi:hypothetical protein
MLIEDIIMCGSVYNGKESFTGSKPFIVGIFIGPRWTKTCLRPC